jgi:hypothetical protein
MFTPIHYGLYFTPAHVQAAQQDQAREPLASAWAHLYALQPNAGAAALWGGLRYRFAGHTKPAEAGVELLLRHTDPALMDTPPAFSAISETLMLAHAYEMLRDFGGFSPAAQTRWRDAFTERLAVLNAPAAEPLVHEWLWLGLLSLAAGIVLEQEDRFQRGVAVFQHAIADEVRPQGFITKAVTQRDNDQPAATFYRQLLSSAALVLMAEAASHVGVNLWDYTVRGVSVITTAIYPIYYFYTTEKWKWEPGLRVEDAQAILSGHGAYLEMVQRRTPMKDLGTLLGDLRPLVSMSGGGLTSLTHGAAEKKRRGLFG